MTSTLQDVAAVMSPKADLDIVFRIKANFEISSWHSKSSDETDVSGNVISVNPKLPILAAIAYTNRNNEYEVRVYYVAKKNFQLAYQIADNSGLTANVVKTCGGTLQLKLYYQCAANKLHFSYNASDNKKENWSIRSDVTN
ncbi:hypothetical protein B0J13DRAFT_603187 [Dactylonectria estremocensis]|uniref:Pesticidal crystal protein domain-containing protein n=1 Tax=Dactylonectria estremocensis TaxID=1079267 RepID=A0A9P9J9J5_9HYPO|nr:hypothetical protein B0J13DRAFT_603187 [Dactylonectria estremocensis]